MTAISVPETGYPCAPAALAAEAGAEECRVAVDGVGIRYLRAGTGPPLLLLHGFLGFSYSWRHNIAPFSRRFTVYAPDLPGTGYSERAALDCSFSGIAAFMLRFMDALGLRGADIVASSHGGAIAMMMAALDTLPNRQTAALPDLEEDARGNRVQRLVLVSPVNPYSRAGRRRIAVLSSRWGRPVTLRLRPFLKATRGFWLRRLYGEPARITPGTAEAYAAPLDVPGSMLHLLRILQCWSADVVKLEKALPRIAGVPTLLIWGSRDAAVPLGSAEPLRRRLRSRLAVLEGAGHLPYEEVPEEFNRLVLEFLASPPSRDAKASQAG